MNTIDRNNNTRHATVITRHATVISRQLHSTKWFMCLLVILIAAWGISANRQAFAQMNHSPVDSMSTVHQHGESHMSSSDSNQEHDHSAMHADKKDMNIITYEAPEEFKTQLDQAYQAYFHIQFALSHDNAAEAKSGAEHLGHALAGVDMSLLAGDAHMAWMKELDTIKKTGAEIAKSDGIDAARASFIHLSRAMITVTKTFGTSGKTAIYQFHCPMADNNKGADWLQNKAELENPFFGSSMFKCGELVETYEKTQ